MPSRDRHPITDDVGQRVRERRLRLGLSQRELADRAGLDCTLIAGIERGERQLGVVTAATLAGALDVDVDALVVTVQP